MLSFLYPSTMAAGLAFLGLCFVLEHLIVNDLRDPLILQAHSNYNNNNNNNYFIEYDNVCLEFEFEKEIYYVSCS